MTRPRPPFNDRPFRVLDRLMAERNIRLPEVSLPKRPDRQPTPEEERTLFRHAMRDVVPLAGRRKLLPVPRQPCRGPSPGDDPEAEIVQRLRKLVETGEGFVLEHTAEYVEGAARWVPPELFRRLHRGHFAVQGHVDLHGLNLAGARDCFDRFLARAVGAGLRTVLVVHGRGRCSPGPPVLKRHLADWLTSGRWKRWVIAFTSARSCDGGTGATYLLLRCRPQSKRQRRPNRRQARQRGPGPF